MDIGSDHRMIVAEYEACRLKIMENKREDR